MKTRVTDQGVVIPRDWFPGIDEVEIRRENGKVVVCALPEGDKELPISPQDPIFEFGRHPCDAAISDASTNLDEYLYDGK